ncbi:MAG: hypothetical protein U0470_08315 [Anaerolineae bacterium]
MSPDVCHRVPQHPRVLSIRGPTAAVRHDHRPRRQLRRRRPDRGGGLLLLIRRHIDLLARGQLLEIRSTEPTVAVELPAWCRMTATTSCA